LISIVEVALRRVQYLDRWLSANRTVSLNWPSFQLKHIRGVLNTSEAQVFQMCRLRCWHKKDWKPSTWNATICHIAKIHWQSWPHAEHGCLLSGRSTLSPVLDPIVHHRSSRLGHVARFSEDTAAHQNFQCHIDVSLGRLPNQSWRWCPGRPQNSIIKCNLPETVTSATCKRLTGYMATCCPLKMSHHVLTLGDDATVLDDYALVTLSRVLRWFKLYNDGDNDEQWIHGIVVYMITCLFRSRSWSCQFLVQLWWPPARPKPPCLVSKIHLMKYMAVILDSQFMAFYHAIVNGNLWQLY